MSCAFSWIAIDEQWVLQTFGLDYRRRCVAGWVKTVGRPRKGRRSDAHLPREPSLKSIHIMTAKGGYDAVAYARRTTAARDR